jgi:DNA repair exonuclease SbcCD ATPase subunit
VEVSAEEYAGVATERSLDVVAAEINVIKSQTAEVIRRSVFEIGKRLCEAKALIGHGNWEAWLRDNVSYSETTARTLMRAYREMGDEQVDLLTGEAPADAFESLNLSQMVALFPLPAHERVAFVKEHEVEGKSVREIEALVAEAVDKGRKEYEHKYREEQARANELEDKLETAEQAAQKAEDARENWEKIANTTKTQWEEDKIKREAEVRELREQADRLAAELEAAKSEPVQESIVYVEKEVEQIDAPEEDEKAAKLAEELKAVQEKLAEAEQRAAAVEHKADMRVQAVNFALREIAGKVADIGGAIDELEQGGEGELAGKLKASAAKAIKTMLEGATWYDLR